MLLLGYRMVFAELCALLNIHINPDTDYVEDYAARETLEHMLMNSVKGTALTIMELEDNIYYLGIRRDICFHEIPNIMSTREMCEKLAKLSIGFKQELKKIGLFKHFNKTNVVYPEPYTIQI